MKEFESLDAAFIIDTFLLLLIWIGPEGWVHRRHCRALGSAWPSRNLAHIRGRRPRVGSTMIGISGRVLSEVSGAPGPGGQQ